MMTWHDACCDRPDSPASPPGFSAPGFASSATMPASPVQSPLAYPGMLNPSGYPGPNQPLDAVSASATAMSQAGGQPYPAQGTLTGTPAGSPYPGPATTTWP